MSQLAGIAGSSSEVRADYRTRVTPLVPMVPSQETRHWSRSGLDLTYAFAKQAPVGSAESNSGAGAFVMGRWSADTRDADPQRVLDACDSQGGGEVARVETYGVACYVEPSGVTWVGTDLLGLFPLYYYATDDVLLFASSPALLAASPDLPRDFDAQGLVGNLLTMHMVGGRTLWKHVRRLTPGHALRWERGKGAREVSVCPVTPSEAYFGESFKQNLDRFDELHDKTIRRDATEGSTALLLSGGLDSRLLASYLRKNLKGPVETFTLGKPTDLEMRIASRVAKRLGWVQHPVDHDISRYLEIAERHLTHQQLANGFNDLAFWYAGERAAANGTLNRCFTGVMGDTVVGGEHIPWGFDPKTQLYTFDTLFARINRYGFKPDEIRELVRRDVLGTALDDTFANMHDTWDACAGLPFQKVWLFDMYFRNRFHLATIPWETATGVWPAIGFVDSPTIRAAVNTPADSMLHRKVQYELLYRHGPDLAALPLDRNSRTELAPVRYSSKWQKLWDTKVMSKYRRALRKYHDRRGIERRYYFRVYDINNDAWRAVRRAAEPHRKLAGQIFRPEVLDRLLPPPDAKIQLKDGIIDAAKTKTLLGFLIWAGKNL